MNLGYTPADATRLSPVVRAATDYFGYDTLGGFDAFGNPLSTFGDSNSNAQSASLLGRIGGTTRPFDGRLETGVFVGQLQDDRRYQEPLAPQDPNQVSSDSRYHSYRTDVQWNNTLHLDDLLAMPALSASAMTYGYEYTGDTAKVRVNENSVSGPFADSVAVFMGTNQRRLCRAADDRVRDNGDLYRVGSRFSVRQQRQWHRLWRRPARARRQYRRQLHAHAAGRTVCERLEHLRFAVRAGEQLSNAWPDRSGWGSHQAVGQHPAHWASVGSLPRRFNSNKK
jgi:hypothetical protein